MTYGEAYIHFSKSKNMVLDNIEDAKMVSMLILEIEESQTIEVHANYKPGKTLLVIKDVLKESSTIK